MVYNLLLFCFSLVVIFQLQLNSHVESRAFIMDDLNNYVKTQARPRESVLQKYIKFLKASFTKGRTAHQITFNTLIWEASMNKTNGKKPTSQTKIQ